MPKRALATLVFLVLLFFLWFPHSYGAIPNEPNPLIRFLNDIEYTTRIKIEFDDNIFLTEDDEDSDFRQIWTQTLNYKLSKDKYYFEGGYHGHFAFYDEESTGLLGHSANLLYSYRPFDGFSIGIRDDYNWLEDSKITTTIGDRVLALGYIQNIPSLQMKYEINPSTTFTTDLYYQFLDVRDQTDDDYIDNKRTGAKGQLNYQLTPEHNWIGFVGFEYGQITFPQISEKESVTQRAFVGLSEKWADVFEFSEEVGFDNIEMKDEANADDSNTEFKFSMETIFSIYTKLRLSFHYNLKEPSLRRQYTQYGSNVAALNLSHLINSRTSLFLNYSYQRQEFNSSDALAAEEKVDREAFIQNLTVTLSRKFINWLTMDFKYDYTKRDSDFAREGYTDNKLSIALTAKY